MDNRKTKYRAVEGDRLAELLEIEQLANKFGFACFMEDYTEFQEGILPKLVQDELNKYEHVAHVLEEILDAENITDVSDEEKEDSLYFEEFDSCGCGCSDNYDNEEDEVEGTYTIVYLEDEDDDTDTDSETAFHWEYDTYWADEFDDFYSESFANSIFKEMEDFVNGKYSTSIEQKQKQEQEQEQKNMLDNVIIGPELYQILEDYFKKLFE